MERSFLKAKLKDITLIQEVAEDSFYQTYKNILSPEQLDWMYDWMYGTESLTDQISSGQSFFILMEENKPLGFISIERKNETTFHFQKIYLHPSAQAKGLGRVLLDKGFSFVKSFELPKARVELRVNRQNKAVDFYKHLGLEIEKEDDALLEHNFYMKDYIMVKYL